MKKVIALCLFSSLFFCSQAIAAPLSADDFLPPVQATTTEAKMEAQQIKQPESVKTEAGIGGKQAISAATAQDAVNAAVQRIASGGGCEQIKFPSGFGWVASGVGVYTAMSNRTATLSAQRLAYQKAYLAAKKNLAQVLHGLGTLGQDELVNEMKTVVDAQQDLVNLSEISRESIAEIVSGMLRGYVVYSVDDKQDAATNTGIVTVTIVATPKTMGRYNRIDPNSLSTDSVRSGLNTILTEISTGLMPPVGGRTITVPQTSEIAFVGFGSAVVPVNSNPAVQVKLRLEAQKIATMRARSALSGVILGDHVSALSTLDTMTKQLSADFEEIQAEDPVAAQADAPAVQKLEQQRSTFVETTMSREQISSIRAGILPAGVIVRTFMNEDNTAADAVAVYMPSVTASAQKAGQAMQQSRIIPGSGNQNGAADPTLPKRGASGQVTRDADL